MAEQMENSATAAKVTAPGLRAKKARGERIVVVTAYDYPAARLAERAGVDALLVGDTLGIMALGHSTTVPVTLDDVLHHCRAVRRGVKRLLLIADMPFGTYQISPEEALRNAVRLMQEGGAHAVKLEGGQSVVPAVRKLVEAGVPVMGHLGLTPQSYHVLGGHKVQGREPEAASLLREDALALQEAGAFAIVLEAIPAPLAEEVTARLVIPTIGIGAGPHCDGQVQVWHDLLGLPPGKNLRHVGRYAEVGTLIEEALRAYSADVREGRFPGDEHCMP